MRFTRVLVVLAVVASIAAAADDSEEPPDSRLAYLIQEAVAWHPRVQSARDEVKAFLAQHRGLEGFYDPQVYASGGAAGEQRTVPGATNSPSVASDTATAESGVERAFSPGFYGSVGAAYRYRWDALGDEDVTQSFVGAQLRIPLLRDRGFRELDLDKQRTIAEFQAARSRLLAAVQALQHDVSLAYIDLQESYSLLVAATDARQRVTTLLAEADELVRLKVVPEYQVHQAKLEVVLREEEEVAAREAFDLARLRLAQLTGLPITEKEQIISSQDLVSWADSVTVNLALPFAQIAHQRGSWMDFFYQQMATEAALRLAREQLKGDLSLRAGVTWQGDSDDGGVDNQRLVTDENVGGAVQLVYTRPLFQTQAKAKVEQQRSLLAASSERLRNEEISLKTGLLEARRLYETVRSRLSLANEAVTLARLTLEAERERFRLGEALSRDVLDSQQDLTNTIRLQTRNAARLLRARADYRFWTGYLPVDLFTQLEAPAEDPPNE